MIETANRMASIFEADVEALVNPVNCVGISGKGLAFDFKMRFPENYADYDLVCKSGSMRIGTVFIHHINPIVKLHTGKRNPLHILNVPTKDHWKDPSKIEYIRDGLKALVQTIEHFNIKSVAIPALGCGCGQLDWADVKPEIIKAFEPIQDRVFVLLFEPK